MAASAGEGQINPTATTNPATEIERLRRQLAREKAARADAESIGEQATAELFETVEKLRTAQALLLERAERERIIADLAREMRQDLDSRRLIRRASRAVGTTTGVDRCQVHITGAALDISEIGDWVDEAVELPLTTRLSSLPALGDLLDEAAGRRHSVCVNDLATDERFAPKDRIALVDALGVRAVAASPMFVGAYLVGWLLLQSVGPRVWRSRELRICEGLASDLGNSLMQVQSYESQRESVQRLQELDRAKNAFISTVSHELRTPLTSITGYLELISEGEMGLLEPELEQGIAVVSRNAQRLQALVEDLLTLSEYDSDTVGLQLSAVDLASVVEEGHDALAPLLTRRRLSVELELGERVSLVSADREQLQRVVTNLLTNAVKFTPDGGRVSVSLKQTESGAVLTVTDTGMGIPEDEQDRLFSRFFRSTLSMTDEIQGTGLGLALCKSVIEAHGGTIALASVEGMGTTVTVDIPSAPPSST